jgi:hypothetical protein
MAFYPNASFRSTKFPLVTPSSRTDLIVVPLASDEPDEKTEFAYEQKQIPCCF